MTNKAYTWRKCIAVVIACVMTLTVVVTPAAAFGEDGGDEGRVVNLVAFGNSMSSGYGMPDFYNVNRGYSLNNNYLEEWALADDGTTLDQWVKDVFGVDPGWTEEKSWTLKAALDWDDLDPDKTGNGRMSNFSYPWRLKEYIANEKGVSRCNLTPICMNGMRTDELRGFLDESFYQETSDREVAYAERYLIDNGYVKTDEPDGEGYYYFAKYSDEGLLIDKTKISVYEGFFRERMRMYAQAFHRGGATADDSYEAACDYIKDSIINADVITVDLSNNNFGTYMGNRLSSFLGMYKQYCPNLYETIDDVNDVPTALRKSLMKIRNLLVSKVPALQSGPGQQLLDIYMFACADCIVNHTKNIKLIRELNPDAKIIVVGINNQMEGLKIQVGETTLNFGDIVGEIYELVDVYEKSLDKDNDDYYFAEIPSDLITFASAIEDAESFDALLNDGTYDEAKGYYSIEMMCDAFIDEYMGGQVDARVKPIIQSVLYQALHDHKVLNIQELVESMSDLSGISTALTQYIADVMSGKEPHLDEGYWQVIMILERFLLFQSVGEHPDADGWDQKYDSILDAYLSDKTARDETKEEICNEIQEEIQEIRQRIKEIKDCMKETFSIKKIKEFVKELADLYKRLKEISEELPSLPETEKLVDSFDDVLAELEETTKELNEKVQALEKTSGELGEQAEELEKLLRECQEQAETDYARIAQLKGKSIWVDLTTKVTFPSETVNIAVSWESDDYADGYVLKVNGAEKEPKKTATGYIYEDSAAEVGKTYEYEVTPYLNYKGEPVYGVATKASVTPKVTVKKSAVKSLKKGTKSFKVKWKKASGVSGYQIRYRADGKTVKKTVKGDNKTSLKVNKVKSGKRYTVRIRTWMKVNGKKYYSKWSAAKKVKVK